MGDMDKDRGKRYGTVVSFPGLPGFFFCSSVCVDGCAYYRQRKLKNRKNRVGLGTRLMVLHGPGVSLNCLILAMYYNYAKA